MKFVAVVAGIGLLALVLVGAGNAYSPVRELGSISLTPQHGSGVSGTASITRGTQSYIFVRATSLASNATYGFALMSPQCQYVRQFLTPLTADFAGDGSSTSQVSGANDGWWLGIITPNDGAAVACGPTTASGGEQGAPATPTHAPPAGGSTVVPVTTPTRVPTPLPGSTPRPPGS
ncbi:MAG: hypothetical protein H0X24_25505 [Ktedonobacterales bacterium]|nr:hypothetical protein [Ktedonobacterales bacterium]